MTIDTLRERLQSAWNQVGGGYDYDPDPFIQEALGLVLAFGNVVAREHGGCVEVSAGGVDTSFATESANGKFRMLCARLSVVFGESAQQQPLLYGGTQVGRIRAGDTFIDAELEFKNSSIDPWFKLRRTTPAADRT